MMRLWTLSLLLPIAGSACAPPCPAAETLPDISGERPDRQDGGPVSGVVDEYTENRAAFTEAENNSVLVAAPLPDVPDDVALAIPAGAAVAVSDWRGNNSFETDGKRFIDAQARILDDLGGLFEFASLNLQQPGLDRRSLIESATSDRCDVSPYTYANEGRSAAVQVPTDAGDVTVEVGDSAIIVEGGERFLVQPTEAFLYKCNADDESLQCGEGQVLVRRLE